MKIKSTITMRIITTLFSFLILVSPVFVFAQIQNPLRVNSITGFISNLLTYIVRVGGVVATLGFIWSGFLYVRARGNPGELETARNAFINTCIGTALLLGAQLIGTIIKGTVESVTR